MEWALRRYKVRPWFIHRVQQERVGGEWHENKTEATYWLIADAHLKTERPTNVGPSTLNLREWDGYKKKNLVHNRGMGDEAHGQTQTHKKKEDNIDQWGWCWVGHGSQGPGLNLITFVKNLSEWRCSCWRLMAAGKTRLRPKRRVWPFSQRNATNRRPNSTVATQETAECDGTQWWREGR